MKKNALIKPAYIGSVVLVTIGAYLTITHSPAANILLGAGMAFWLVFIVIALFEIWTSEQRYKILWTIGLLLSGVIVGLLYLLAGRHTVAPKRVE